MKLTAAGFPSAAGRLLPQGPQAELTDYRRDAESGIGESGS